MAVSTVDLMAAVQQSVWWHRPPVVKETQSHNLTSWLSSSCLLSACTQVFKHVWLTLWTFAIVSGRMIMATLCNRAGHYILPCGFFFYLLSFFHA